MRRIPFFANTKDDMHCVQAALKMALKYYHPNENFSFNYLDRITGRPSGKWTYPYKMELWLSRHGFEVAHVELFSVAGFARNGVNYLKSIWTRKVFEVQARHSAFDQAQNDARGAIEAGTIRFVQKKGDLATIRTYFKKGYFVMARVNPYVIRGEEASGSHIMVVTKIDSNYLWLHDPGLPPMRHRRISVSAARKALYDNNSLVVAIRPRSSTTSKAETSQRSNHVRHTAVGRML